MTDETTGLDGNGVARGEVTVGGVTLPAGSTPQQRFAAIAKQHGATLAPAQGVPFGPRLPNGAPAPTEATGVHFMQEEARAAGEEAPPPPQIDAGKIAQFDADMRREGHQMQIRGADGKFAAVSPDALDRVGIDTLNAAYMKIMAPLEKLPPSTARDNNMAKFRQQLQDELGEFHRGRRLGETRAQFKAREAGTTPPAAAPNTTGFTPNAGGPTLAQWEAAHRTVLDANGDLPLDRINPKALSGYTLPKLVEGQTYKSNVFRQLADARAAGITQGQVNAHIRAEAIREGWIKAS